MDLTSKYRSHSRSKNINLEEEKYLPDHFRLQLPLVCIWHIIRVPVRARQAPSLIIINLGHDLHQTQNTIRVLASLQVSHLAWN